MKKTFAPLLILAFVSACTQGGAEKPFSFISLIDTQVVEFQSGIDMVIVATMAFVGLVHLFFG